MNARKEKIAASARPPTSEKRGETERFVLRAKDGSRVAEIEIRESRPRVEVLIWKGCTFAWHNQTRRYIEATSVNVPLSKASPRERQSSGAGSFQFDSDDSE
jgi:hypothetical protein